jgi:preprotein translocase subunit SecY
MRLEEQILASAAEQLVANLNFATFCKARELHKRLLFTLGALLVYRLGTFIPIPGIDPAAFARAFQGQSNGLLGMFNMFSGGAVERMALFALNVMPYISASIIVQLLGSMYPPWEKLKKEEGEAGRKQLNQYTRYLTVVLSVGQALAIALSLQNSEGMVRAPGPAFILSTVVTLTAGSMFLMWLGEQITSRGVGNGISLLILAGIVAVLPRTVSQIAAMVQTGAMSSFAVAALVGAAALFVVAIVFMELGQRRLPVHYPRRQSGARAFGGESSFLPLKVNTAGVIPPIFASSLLLLPATLLGFLGAGDGLGQTPWIAELTRQLQHGRPLFMVVYGALIIFFTFFYTSVVFNPEDTADNLRKYGGFLPGVRPGRQTAEHLDRVLSRLTVIGAAYITVVCLLPEGLIGAFNVPFYLGGTSLLIVVSVTIDLLAQVQSHLVAHQYEGMIRNVSLRRSNPDRLARREAVAQSRTSS